MPRYSVIVPVYNVAPYLRECLDSILAQDSPSEYEVILVDDGSTDNSGAICDEYAEKHTNFKVIHQKNSGLSGARNAGTDIAVGEFILYFDSDDIWTPELLSSMDKVAEQRADITLFAFERFDEQGNTAQVYPALTPAGESGEEYLQRLFAIGAMPPPSAWDCMFRREFLRENHLHFRLGMIYEDLDFEISSLPAAQSVIWVDKVLYRYRVRAMSISQQPNPEKWIMLMGIIDRWIERYPNSATANFYCNCGLSIPTFGTEEQTRDLVSRYAQGTDILKFVSQPKMKLARFLYRMLGYYNGAKAFLLLVKVKHLFNKPAI